MRATQGSGTATVLFTDIVGSTEVLARLGDLRYDEVRRDHFAVLRHAVSEAGGDEVKTMGDGMIAVFGSGVDALTCAVAMQQGVYRQRQNESELLEIRVGLSLGEVTFEDGDIHGTAVVEAARLVARAGPSEILATGLLRAVVGTRSPAGFIDRGALELKGLPEPVPTYEVVWAPKAEVSLPLPPLFDRTHPWSFVGRDQELEGLRRLWKDALAGQRGVALLGGEPGVGKTRLVAELARAVHADGAVVLAGRCDEDLAVPYQPFAEALRHYVDHSLAGLAGRLGRYGGDLARLIPEIAKRVPDLPPALSSDPDSERLRLFEAVAGWVAAAGDADGPVLLVVDDLQWAAKPTLLMLRHLIVAAGARRLLIVATYRDSDLTPGHPVAELLADLHREDRVQRFPLAGLDEDGVRAFLAAAAGHDLEEAGLTMARAVHAETAGNPFFVGEVIGHLRESGAVVRRDGRWVSGVAAADLSIPAGVREVVERRLRRLSDLSNTVLRSAAVLGAEFELDVLRHMVAAGEAVEQEALLGAIEEAVAARLVIEMPTPAMSAVRFRFAHSLVRDALYGGLSAARRQVMHGRAALATEAVNGGHDDLLPTLAFHFGAAGAAGDPAKAVEYARRAGDQAMARLAFEPAATFYDQAIAALALAPTVEIALGGQLLLARGGARARSDDHAAWDDYLAAADLARELGDAEALGQAALGLDDVWVWSWLHSDAVRIDLLDEALAAQGGADTPLRARLAARLAGQLYWVPGSLPRRQALAAESVTVARRLGDPAALAACLDSTTFAVWIPGEAERRRAAGEEIVALAKQARDRELAIKGHAWCHIASLEENDTAALDEALAAYEKGAAELGQARYQWYALTRRTMRAILAGDLDAGEALAQEALTSGRNKGEGDAEPLFGCQMSLVWQERPSSDAVDQLETVRRMYRESPPRVPGLMATALAHGIVLALGAGRDDEVRAELDRLGEIDLASLEPSMAWTGLMAKVASALAGVGTEAEMAALYELILPAAGMNAFCFGAVSY
ncbi:MAG: ATP-binding protein, partial [Acidimicrobiia bacterium]